MSVVLVNGVPCALIVIEQGESPSDTLAAFLDSVEHAATHSSFEYAEALRESGNASPYRTVRNVIVDVRATLLAREVVVAQHETLRTRASGLLDYLRVIGDGFDVTMPMS